MGQVKHRKWMAWLLIAAYLPMLLASALHVHHPVEAEREVCHDCAHHVSHPAHLDTYNASAGDCLYCHLLSLPRVALAMAVGVLLTGMALRYVMPTLRAVAAKGHGTVRLRAPPRLAAIIG